MPATLVLLPGLDGTEAFLRPLVEALGSSVRPVVVRFPQTGSTEYSELLAVVREATVGIPEYYVLGLSFSGPLAVMLAADEPARVKGILLVGTFLRSPRRVFELLRFACSGPVFGLLLGVKRVMSRVFGLGDAAVRHAEAEVSRLVSARCLAARARALLVVDVRSTLQRCRQPVACITFEQDCVVPRSNAEEIGREAPQAVFRSIPGGHLSGCMNGNALAQHVVEFLRGNEPD